MSRIAVITRTKNRPLLLRRCLNSLVEQKCKDFFWVIVNDNGVVSDVDIVANLARDRGIATQVIHRNFSSGIAAAANQGVLESDSEFIHIHDDDDTLEPDFYSELLNFLDKNTGYMGAISCTNRVDERVRDGVVDILRKYPYYHFDSTLFISDLFWKNQYSPVSFVYRRSALGEVGLYDEHLPVLDDWDFNIRFSLCFDIGVVSKFLANYHWRVGPVDGSNSQTVSAGSTLHQEYTAVIRNKFLRKDLSEGRGGVGLLMSIGRYHQLHGDKLRLMDDKLSVGLSFRRFAKNTLNFFWRK